MDSYQRAADELGVSVSGFRELVYVIGARSNRPRTTAELIGFARYMVLQDRKAAA